MLAQRMAAFRHIMHGGAFGKRFVWCTTERMETRLASRQSRVRLDLGGVLRANRFDMVIVDEFHHARESTRTYARLL